jgi:hypothetical protein
MGVCIVILTIALVMVARTNYWRGWEIKWLKIDNEMSHARAGMPFSATLLPRGNYETVNPPEVGFIVLKGEIGDCGRDKIVAVRSDQGGKPLPKRFSIVPTKKAAVPVREFDEIVEIK